jgi:hypothetical protein
MQVVASAADLAIGMLSTATFGRARAQLFRPCRLADRERIESASERGVRSSFLAVSRAREAEPSAAANPGRALGRLLASLNDVFLLRPADAFLLWR